MATALRSKRSKRLCRELAAERVGREIEFIALTGPMPLTGLRAAQGVRAAAAQRLLPGAAAWIIADPVARVVQVNALPLFPLGGSDR